MNDSHKVPTILVLAGKRDGVPGPLAEAAGVSHKAIMPVAGKPLIGHILTTLEAAWDDAKILVSIHDASILESVEEARRLIAAGRLQTVEAQRGIVESLEEAAKHIDWPLLITTADSALATVDGLHQINAAGQDRRADVVLGLAQREVIRAAHPDGQWGFYEFKDMAISNCNMFWMKDANALKAAEAFRTGGQFFKNIDRIRKAFGLWNLIRFRLKMDTVYGAMDRISKRFGVRVIAHMFDDGELAIDVDNKRTLRVTEELLAKRRTAA